MRTIKGLRIEIRKKYKELRNWEAVGRHYGLNRGMAWRIAREKGYEPKDPKIRMQLGLPAMGMAPRCAECGEVHVSARCARRPRRYSSLWEIPVRELRRRLDEREDI